MSNGNETPNKNIDFKVDKKTFKEFVDKKVEDQGENFINKIKESEKNKDKTKLENYKEIFGEIWKETLKIIWESMRDNFHNIDSTNKQAPKLQTYIEAKKAFEEDMNTLGIVDVDMKEMLIDIQNFIDLKQINIQTDWTKIISSPKWLKETASDPKINIPDQWDPTKWVMDWIIAEIDKRMATIAKGKTEENTTRTTETLNKNRTPETAKSLFETTNNEKNFNATFDEIAKIIWEKIETYTNTTNIEQQNKVTNFVSLIKNYTNDQKINNISLQTANKDNAIYPEWTRIIRFDTIIQEKSVKDWEDIMVDKKVSKDIIFWSQDNMQAKKSEKFDITQVNLSLPNPLAQFDGKGNYRALEKYINAKPDEFIKTTNFKNIVDAILTYTNEKTETTDRYEDIHGLKNGYANVLTNYVVNHSTPLPTVISYLTIDKLNILGVDKGTRKDNYNKLFFSDPQNNILRPEVNTMVNAMTETEKKALLVQIGNIRNAIENKDKLSPTETLSKWLDSLIDAFGPMLFSVLKMFGFGKWSLLKMFPWAKDKINNIYKKEYDLSEKQIDSINTIIETDFENTPLRTDKLPSTKELQKGFKDKKNSYDTYITKIANNVKYVNISIFQNWLNTYNKDNKKEININDIVNIDTDATTKKQTITTIKDKGMFQSVMGSILASENTRWRVAAANQEIQVERKEKNIGTWFDEQGLEVGKDKESARYLISTQKDIARYLTASLFSNKDLSYVMTENELHNGKTTNTKTPNSEKEKKTPETPKETLTFIDKDKYFDKEWKLNDEWNKKAIHEVVDVAKSPKKLQIIRGTVGINIEQKTINNVLTYAEEWRDTRIATKKWDKIEEVTEKTPEIKIADTRKTIKTELNKEWTKTAKTNFEWPTYTLDDKNAYQTQIGKISNFFTSDYKRLISETNQTTFKSLIKDNTSEFKNMFTYMSLKQNDNKNTDENFKTDKLDLTAVKALTSNTDKTIDLTKQNFALKEATDTKTTITVTKNSTDVNNTAKEWSITLVTDDKGKLTVTREETPIKKA